MRKPCIGNEWAIHVDTCNRILFLFVHFSVDNSNDDRLSPSNARDDASAFVAHVLDIRRNVSDLCYLVDCISKFFCAENLECAFSIFHAVSQLICTVKVRLCVLCHGFCASSSAS